MLLLDMEEKPWLSAIVKGKRFTFGAPAFSSRLSIPAGHLPYEAVLSWNVETLFAIRASRFSSPLTHHWGVVVVRRHLAAGWLVGVTGGAALAQVEGLLSLQQVWTPVKQNGIRTKKTPHIYTLWSWAFFVIHSLWRFSSEKVIHHVRICFQQTHQNLVLQFRRHLKTTKVVSKKHRKSDKAHSVQHRSVSTDLFLFICKLYSVANYLVSVYQRLKI